MNGLRTGSEQMFDVSLGGARRRERNEFTYVKVIKFL